MCRFSQQAAEKALKAVLVLESIESRYVHDLQHLRNLLPDGWPDGPGLNVLASLTAWGSKSKCPRGCPEPTAEDAASAVADAWAVNDSIAAEFEHRGVAWIRHAGSGSRGEHQQSARRKGAGTAGG